MQCYLVLNEKYINGTCKNLGTTDKRIARVRLDPYDGHDTVGVVALDTRNNRWQ